MSKFQALREQARSLDQADPLAPIRAQFELPADQVYLCGNSLGALPRTVPDRIHQVVTEEWGQHQVSAWNRDHWWTAPERVGEAIAPLLGAGPGQVVVSDSTSINLFKCYLAGARLRPGRTLIVTDPGAFPTDQYVLSGAAPLAQLSIVTATPAEIPQLLRDRGSEIAVVSLSQVDYRTGELWDLGGLTALIRQAGALSLWDLCHSAGVVEPDLDHHLVDFAVGCGYKYLSGGPGAPSFVYVAERHHAALEQPLTGWHGHARPFAMAGDYQAAPGISQLRVGSPPMLSLLALEAALTVFHDVSLAATHTKARALTEFFAQAAADLGQPLNLASPHDPARRAAQLSLRHPAAFGVVQALARRGVIGDFREPNIVRLGFAPLYTRFADALLAANALVQVLEAAEFTALDSLGRDPTSIVT